MTEKRIGTPCVNSQTEVPELSVLYRSKNADGRGEVTHWEIGAALQRKSHVVRFKARGAATGCDVFYLYYIPDTTPLEEQERIAEVVMNLLRVAGEVV